VTNKQKHYVDTRAIALPQFILRAKWLFYSAAGQIVVAAASLAGIRVYTELLSRAEFGLAMMAMGIVAFFDGLIVMALNQTLLSVCARIDGVDRQRQVAVGLAFRLFRALALVLAPLAALALSLAAAFPIDTVFVFAPALALAYYAEELAKTSMLSPLVVRREYFRFSLWQATEAVVTLALTGLSLAFVRADAFGFLLGLIAARVFTTSLFLCVFFGGRYFVAVDLAAAKPHLATAVGYGAPVSAMAPVGWVGSYLDRYVISAFGGLASTGVYTAVAGLVGRPYGITTVILTNYFRPLLFQGCELQEGMRERRRVQWRWIVAAGVIGVSGAVAFSFLSGVISTLVLAREYRDGAPAIMIVLSLAQTFAIMTHAVDNAVLSTGASARLLRMQVWLVIVALILVPLWTLRFGALGAAIGRLLSEAVKFGATTMMSRRLLGGLVLARPGISTP
jgi:O-antigen/teichoic acid export membrane protein